MIVRTGQASAVTGLLQNHPTLYAAAAAQKHSTSQGRVPAYVIHIGPEPWLIRHFHRGGLVEKVMSDRYARWTGNRAMRELYVSVEARLRGIATPEVIAAAQYPAFAFARFDIVVQFIEPAEDLAALLFSRDREITGQQVECAAVLIRDVVKHGLMHPDLNLKNIIVSDDQAWVIDLDRCVLRGARRVDANAMKARFIRSLEKWQKRTGKTVPAAHRKTLTEAFGGAAAA